jgi:hypothetical protein
MTVQQTAYALALLLRDPERDLERLAKLIGRKLGRNEEARTYHYRARGRKAPASGSARTPFRKIHGRGALEAASSQ